MCVGIRNWDLKSSYGRNCDYLQVHWERRWDGDSNHGNGVGMGTVSAGTGVGWGQTFSPCSSLVCTP